MGSNYRSKTFRIEPRTENQAQYLDDLRNHEAVLGVGCAGTGKTYLALSVAIEMLMNKDIRQIVVSRPNVSADENALGFHKGTKEEKVAEWMGPIIATISKAAGPDKLAEWLQGNKLVFEALETMRGQTYDDSMVILDEAQNTSLSTLKMILTRIGENARVAINGDSDQTDLEGKSGLSDLVRMVAFNPYRHVPVVSFTPNDVVRSQICKDFIMIFRDWEHQRSFH